MRPLGLICILFLGLAICAPARADDTVPEPAAPSPAAAKPRRVLTPEEMKEKELRKACKIEICDVLYAKEAEGPDIACDIIKTWREEDIEDMITGGKIDWPWGAAKCTTKLSLSRAMLAKSTGAGPYTVKMQPHQVSCSLDRKSEGKTYDVTVAIEPEVTFEKGKSVEGQVNWGDIDAPMLAYGVIWPGAKLDNNLNIFGGTVVKMVNEFVTAKCAEVKDELPSRKAEQ